MIDETVVTVQAGDGGDGLVSFRREKYVPRGGPDGGDGGKGGDIWFVATTGLNTLSDFNRLKQFKAPNGAPGGPKNRSGKFAQDLTLKVPIGTIIYEIGSETKKKLFDFTKPDEQYLVVKGGKGGLGNQHFATPTHQAPRYATKGEKGEQKTISLELQLIAQVGLIGLPNVGKSSLLARISKATPKIANYPFTTLEPELGVVIPEWFNINAPSFVVADIPGLIEHASQGKGLGHTRFTRCSSKNAKLSWSTRLTLIPT
ncbi:GTPase ObgE [Candidatus Berkelbacteria bacterium]|nr:GTPase ObgE [Candidatus Berkelbacteria bacterium]